MIVSIVANTAKAITNFAIISPPANGTITESTHTITLTVPYATGVTALTPTIAINGASVSPASGVAQNFTFPVTYTVTAANGSTQAYAVIVNVAPFATQTFYYTGAQQSWIVPASVTKIRITATGAAGGLGSGSTGLPGAGGQMVAELNVNAGDTYYIYAGGRGGNGGLGWNGGGIDGHLNTCTYAGGATDIRYSGSALTNRILVVGGGGGVGANGLNNGGFGAGTLNAPGGAGQTAASESTGGAGGTEASGGSGGNGDYGTYPANSGTLGNGASNNDYGGAGGGGYYGGGSGGSGFSGNHSGGGGGSSYLALGTYISGIDGYNNTTDGGVVIDNISP